MGTLLGGQFPTSQGSGINIRAEKQGSNFVQMIVPAVARATSRFCDRGVAIELFVVVRRSM
jgi:hypothetical protein